MARAVEHGVFPFFRGLDGKLAVQPERMFPSEEDARRAAEVFAGVLGGAVAFSRVRDEQTGAVEPGVIIGKYGVMADGSAGESPEDA